MPKLYIYRGLPGSGKTRLASVLASDNGVVAGRDHIRMAMFSRKQGLTQDQENLVTKAQDELIKLGLKNGMDVHVDDMNLKSQYVKRLIKLGHKYGATTVIKDLTYLELEECLTRNAGRDLSSFVPEEVIRNLHQRFIKGKPYPLPVPSVETVPFAIEPYVEPEYHTGMERVVIVDLDGTLAIHDGRSPYDYSLVGTDLVNHQLFDLLTELYHSGNTIAAVSGRPDSCRADTQYWLDKKGLSGIVQELHMRKASEPDTEDSIVKYEIFNEHFRHRVITCVFDDRNRVVAMWRELGLLCLQVNDGDF